MARRMVTPTLLLFLLIIIVCILPAACVSSKHAPTGVHLSLGDDDDQMVVTWVTLKHTTFSTVELYHNEGGRPKIADVGGDDVVRDGPPPPSQITNGTQREFVDGGPAKAVRFVHTVVLRDLRPGNKYFYRVGGHSTSPKHWSGEFFFFAKRTPAQISAGPPLRQGREGGDIHAHTATLFTLASEYVEYVHLLFVSRLYTLTINAMHDCVDCVQVNHHGA